MFTKESATAVHAEPKPETGDERRLVPFGEDEHVPDPRKKPERVTMPV